MGGSYFDNGHTRCYNFMAQPLLPLSASACAQGAAAVILALVVFLVKVLGMICLIANCTIRLHCPCLLSVVRGLVERLWC